MKLKITKKHLILLISLTIFFSLFSTEALAQQQTHTFKFYLDPMLVPNMSFAKEVLPKYVHDMNYIISKNTNRVLLFDLNTGIGLTETQPYTGSAGILPTEGYEIWAHVVLSQYNYSYGGYMSFNYSGDAVLAGLKWKQIYDPDTLVEGSIEMRDYWIQIDHMLHELAHVYSAGTSEYYNLITIEDSTGVEPPLNISATKANDSYWSKRTEYFSDPLLWLAYDKVELGNPNSRTELLNAVKFSPLTAHHMNAGYRISSAIPMPDLENINIKVVDKITGYPLPGSQVKIWSVRSFPPYYSELREDNLTDFGGVFTFDWGGGESHNNYNHLRLIKVYQYRYLSKAEYVSVFDAESVRNLDNKTIWDIEIALEPVMVNQAPVADAGQDQEVEDSDGNGYETIILNGSGSYDVDGQVVSYEWKENRVVIGSGETSQVNLSVGNHTIELVVTDDGGLQDTEYINIVVNEHIASNILHIGDIKLVVGEIKKCKGKRCHSINATIPVLSGDGPVKGVLVSVAWSGAYFRSDYGYTNIDGNVFFKADLAKGKGVYTISVLNVEKDGYTYNSSLNVETTDSLII